MPLFVPLPFALLHSPSMRRPLLLAALAALVLPAAHAQTDDTPPLAYRIGAPVADDGVALVVEHDGTRDTLRADVFASSVMNVMMRNPALGADSLQARELVRSMAEGFVLETLVNATLDRTPDLAADTAAASAQMATFEMQTGGAAAFDSALVEQGLTRASLRAMVERQLRQRALLDRWADAAPAPAPADVAAYRLRMADEVTVRHIIWLYPETEAQAAAVQATAQAVRDSLAAGADFAALAMRHGQDGTAPEGGLLPAFNRAAPMDQDFKDAAFALTAPGQLAPGLVESQFGWHVIRLDKRERGALMPEDEAREALRGEAADRAVRDRFRALVAADGVVVRVNPTVVDADLNTPLR